MANEVATNDTSSEAGATTSPVDATPSIPATKAAPTPAKAEPASPQPEPEPAVSFDYWASTAVGESGRPVPAELLSGFRYWAGAVKGAPRLLSEADWYALLEEFKVTPLG